MVVEYNASMLVALTEVTLHCTFPPVRLFTPLLFLSLTLTILYCCCMKRTRRKRIKQKL
jgi:hypothetical protein